MSKRDYTNYARKNEHEAKREEVYETPAEVLEPAVIEPEYTTAPIVFANESAPEDISVETVPVPETVEGVVANCAKLNVRANPDANANVLCVLNSESEIEIVLENSTRDWFYVITATGIEGYCMRKFISAHL